MRMTGGGRRRRRWARRGVLVAAKQGRAGYPRVVVARVVGCGRRVHDRTQVTACLFRRHADQICRVFFDNGTQWWWNSTARHAQHTARRPSDGVATTVRVIKGGWNRRKPGRRGGPAIPRRGGVGHAGQRGVQALRHIVGRLPLATARVGSEPLTQSNISFYSYVAHGRTIMVASTNHVQIIRIVAKCKTTPRFYRRMLWPTRSNGRFLLSNDTNNATSLSINKSLSQLQWPIDRRYP